MACVALLLTWPDRCHACHAFNLKCGSLRVCRRESDKGWAKMENRRKTKHLCKLVSSLLSVTNAIVTVVTQMKSDTVPGRISCKRKSRTKSEFNITVKNRLGQAAHWHNFRLRPLQLIASGFISQSSCWSITIFFGGT